MNRSESTMTKFKYQNLYCWVVDKIKDGTYAYNSKLPSEAAFCNDFHISRQTVRNALEQLAEDGYIYSVKGSGSFVRKHIRQREKKIGVLFTTVSGYICADILGGLEGVLTARGYSIQLELSHNRTENETRFLKKMCDSQVSGLIIEATKSNFPSPNAALYRQLDEAGIPYVFVNSFYSNVPCNAVVWDDERVAYKLTSHLIKSGHPRIGCIFRFDEMQGAQRYTGYTRALLENNIDINENLICWYSDPDGYIENKNRQASMIDSFVDYIAGNCSALVCYNDIIAGTVINKLRSRDIRIPEQISIVSFDNSDLVQLFGLETFYSFNHPKGRIGQAAAKLLLKLIHGDADSERHILTVTSPEEDIAL